MSTTERPAAACRILVVEDEPAINDIVATALRYQGHSVTQLDDGREGLTEALRAAYDLVVLDVMLPGLDGFEICRRMRDAGQLAPVLFLTARAETEDRIQGFLTGGDDYLTKPFSVDELVLRVGAILRRVGTTTTSDLIVFDDLTLDPTTHEVRRGGRLVDLSPTRESRRHSSSTGVRRGRDGSRRRSPRRCRADHSDAVVRGNRGRQSMIA